MSWLIPLSVTLGAFWVAVSSFAPPARYGWHLLHNLMLLLIAANVAGLAWVVWLHVEQPVE